MSYSEVFVITGEPSGDRHAAPVVAELIKRGYAVTGVGGPRMRQAGATLLYDSTGWGAMGVPQSVRKLPALFVRSRVLLRYIAQTRPRVVVLVNFGYFNVSMARHLKRLGGCKVLYYFPPGSWRQEPRDWSDLAAITDCIATPFLRNAEHLRQSGANAHWVGHPVVDELRPVTDRSAFRQGLGLPEGRPIIGLLPGSRWMERRIIGPLMTEAAVILRAALPQTLFLWSSWPQFDRLEAWLHSRLSRAGEVVFLTESHDILKASDLVLVAMGTAALEAAAALTPMVTTYDGPRMAKWIAQKVLHQQQRFYAMPNLLLGREVVPEIVPRHWRDQVAASALATAVQELLGDGHRLWAMRDDLAQVRTLLGEPGAASRTADLIDGLIRESAVKGP